MTREEILEAITDDKTMPFIQPDQLASIVDFVIKNSKPSLPSNLDEAAEKNFETMEVLEHENIFEETHNKIFKAGAEWMAGQGLTLEGRVCKDDYAEEAPFYYVETENSDDLPIVGEKVVVQIRKK